MKKLVIGLFAFSVFAVFTSSGAPAQDSGICGGPDGLVSMAEGKVRKTLTVNVTGDWQESARILQVYVDSLAKEKGFMAGLFAHLRTPGRALDPGLRTLGYSVEDIRVSFSRKNAWVDCGPQDAPSIKKKWIEIPPGFSTLANWRGPFVCINPEYEEAADTFFKNGIDADPTVFLSHDPQVPPEKGVVITGAGSCLNATCGQSMSAGIVKVCTLVAPKSGCIDYPALPAETEVAGKDGSDFHLLSVADRIKLNDQIFVTGVQAALSGSGCVYPVPKAGETSAVKPPSRSTRRKIAKKAVDAAPADSPGHGPDALKAAP